MFIAYDAYNLVRLLQAFVSWKNLFCSRIRVGIIGDSTFELDFVNSKGLETLLPLTKVLSLHKHLSICHTPAAFVTH